MSAKDVESIIAKLEMMYSLIGDIIELYDVAKMDDEYYADASSMRGLEMMLELNHSSIHSHEAFNKSIKESQARIAKIDEAIAANKKKAEGTKVYTQDAIDKVIAEAKELVQATNKNKLQ